MRESYSVILIVIAVLNLICIIRSISKRGKLAAHIRVLLLAIIIQIMGHVLIISASGMKISALGYYAYLAGSDWMFYFGILTMLEYSGFRNRLAGMFKKLFFVITALDTISIVLNTEFDHVFGLNELILEDGKVYYQLFSHTGHQVHLILVYLMFGFMLGTMIYKALVTPKIYVERYLVIIFSLLLTAIWESYYIFADIPVDKSMTGYGICGVLVYYFSLEYTPIFIVRQMLLRVVNGISEAVLFFDMEGKCIYVNEAAGRSFGINQNNGATADSFLMELLGDYDMKNDQDYSRKIVRNRENGLQYLIVEFHRLENRKKQYISSFFTIRDYTEEENEQRKKRFYATHDRLTGLYNKEYFEELVREKLRKNPTEDYYIVTSNIKNFKHLNDNYGHEFGDEMLLKLTNTIAKYASEDSLYCRLHNDRFSMLVNSKEFEEERFLMDPVAAWNLSIKVRNPIAVHVGVYKISSRELPVSAMLDRATMALDSIRDDYGVRVAYYNEKLREDRLWEQKVSGQIEDAIKDGQIVPYLQPQVDKTGSCWGAELLVRWIHPTEGFLSPARFIPIIEKNGLIAKVDLHMWEEACRLLAEWKQKGVTSINLSVNISPKDIYFLDIVEELKGLVKKYDIGTERLHLEITETVMMNNEMGLNIIKQLREAGFVVEMDDFGSGYSSLNMLKDMPIDVLKIDMLFLNKTSNKEKAETIIQSVLELSEKLGIKSLTEGVETKEQLDMLTEMGCCSFQGYYFARPMPVEEFERQYVFKKE